uniref:Reverse transcriptase Ty1/copia-type domain-containing protein n=1 Tax=Vitis vinifera TaxID=29760 RepID=A5B0Q1_VITVI|nr:hypothetical protein VITISV_001832 [Vitis vinifera]
MDVNGAFLKGILSEEVYVEQPRGFEDPKFPNHVYRLKKTLYGLKQVPRVCLALCFVEEMKIDLEMSMVGELTFILGLQIRQLKDGIFLSQSKYAKELIKNVGLESIKHFRTPMSTTTQLSKDAFDIPTPTRSGMLRIEKTHLMFVSLLVIVLWFGLKLLYATPMDEANDKDYEIEQGTINIHCYNSSAINISKNLKFSENRSEAIPLAPPDKDESAKSRGT